MVGIVAGALVGVVVLSGIVGYFFRQKCSKDKDEDDAAHFYDGSENPFGTVNSAYGNQSRGDMRRESQMLADGMDDGMDGNSIHQMSELGHNNGPVGMGMYNGGMPQDPYSNVNAIPVGGIMGAGGAGAAAAAGAYGLNRADTSVSGGHGMPMSGSNGNLPGLSRNDTMNPRPPTMIQRHYAAQQQMAMNNSGPPPMPSFQPGQVVDPSTYYPSNQLNQAGPYPSFQPAGGPAALSHQSSMRNGPGGNLARNGTLSNEGHGNMDEYPARSGTPEYNNPQQYFHQAHDSFSSQTVPFGESPDRRMNDAPMPDYASQATTLPGYPNPYARDTSQMVEGNARAKRTLSVRNGGLDDGGDNVRNSVYGGM